MKIRTIIIAGFLLLSIPLSIIGIVNVRQLNSLTSYVNSSLSRNSNTFDSLISKTDDMATQAQSVVLISVVSGVIISLLFGIVVGNLVSLPIKKLRDSVKAIANGDFSKPIDISGKDEITDLARDVDIMTQNLKTSQENIEQKVAERTAQLEKINKAMVGRELTMIELKKKLSQT